MTSELETRLSAWMQATPVSAEALSFLRETELPARRRFELRAPLLRASAVAAAILIIGVVAFSWPSLVRPPVAAVPPDPAAFRGDARLAQCVGGGPDPLAAFEMAHASDYRQHLPAMGLSPELDRADPAFVVVLGVGGAPGGGAPGAGGGLPNGSPSSETPGPNVHDVCVLVGSDEATAERTIYSDVDTTGLRADISSLPPPSTSLTAACQARNLQATGETIGSALGNAGAIVRLTNVSTSECVVAGYPDVQLLGSSGQLLTTVATDATEGDYLFPAMPVTEEVLAPGETASFQLGYPDNPSGADAALPRDIVCPTATSLRVVLPRLLDPLSVDLQIAPCGGHLNVSPIHAGSNWIEFSLETPGPTAGAQVNLAAMAWFDRSHGLFVGSTGSNGDVGTVWRTTDGGRSWQSVTLPGGGLSVVTISGTAAWAGSNCSPPAPCRNGLFRSDDGGLTWTRVAFQPVAAMAFADEVHGWATAFDQARQSEPSIIVTADGGATWEPRPSPCPQGTGGPVALSFPAANRGWLACNETLGAGSAAKAILRTTDGVHWKVMATMPFLDGGQPVGQIGTDGYLSGLSMAANGAGMYWADRGVSDRTGDGGSTWTGMSATSFDVVIPASGWAIDKDKWLLYVWNSEVGSFQLEESTDGGGSWGAAEGFVPPS